MSAGPDGPGRLQWRLRAPLEGDPVISIRPEERASRTPSGPRIRCPRCRWQPRQGDRWACHCGHVWNTFDTGGRCPGCTFQWTITQCLSCQEMSPHEDWYERGAEPGAA